MSMPRTKKQQAAPRSQAEAPPVLFNGPSGDVLTLADAAAYLRLAESEVVGLVHSQGLPGRCVAGDWRFLKSAVQHWLATASPTWDTRKAAILELAGKYNQDPDLEQIVKEAYRGRGLPVSGRDTTNASRL
jgi:Helix-turn-helix domain